MLGFVLGFGVWVSGLGFWVWVWGFGFMGSGLWFKGFWCSLLGLGFRV